MCARVHNKSDSMVCKATSAALFVQAGDVDGRYIDPFRLGLSCLGGITLFLAGLIRCSLYYDQWGRDHGR